MATAQLGAVVRHIRTLATFQKNSEQTDDALLRAFLRDRDQLAFEALVRRHGPMVLRVCRRTLGNIHDAEDALQATFLALAQKAASIRKRGSLASWLHGVAYRMATDARKAAARRHRRDSRAGSAQPCDPALTAAWKEIQVLLDEEINRLPETLRATFILCCLENKSSTEAARQLGLQETAVWKRLSRARKLLQERLTRRGVSLSAVLAAIGIGAEGAAAAVPTSLALSTAQAATLLAAGQATAEVLVSAKVAALTEGVLKAMFLTKLKTTAVVLLAVALAGTGAGVLTYRTLAAGQAGGGTTASVLQTPKASDQAQIPKLIDQLGSDKFAERERATKELDKIGVPALEALRKAAQSDDPERRNRAQQLVQKIEGRALAADLLAPKRVHLVYKNTPLTEAVADFTKQSGYKLTLSDPEGKLKDRKVTLDTGEVTFWQALDQFCQKAGLVESPPATNKGNWSEIPYTDMREPANNGSMHPGIILTNGKAQPQPTDDRTAVRIRAGRTTTPNDREIRVALQITPEPRLHRLEIVALHIKKATDDQGQSLEQVSSAAPWVDLAVPPWSREPSPRRGVGGDPGLVRLRKGPKVASFVSELGGTLTVRTLVGGQATAKAVTCEIPFTLKNVPVP
jgi:RNA polymerase sigma factor (sigma-70 family)